MAVVDKLFLLIHIEICIIYSSIYLVSDEFNSRFLSSRIVAIEEVTTAIPLKLNIPDESRIVSECVLVSRIIRCVILWLCVSIFKLLCASNGSIKICSNDLRLKEFSTKSTQCSIWIALVVNSQLHILVHWILHYCYVIRVSLSHLRKFHG